MLGQSEVGQLPGSRDPAHLERRAIEDDPSVTTLATALRAAAEKPIPQTVTPALVLLNGRGSEQRLTYPALWLAARKAAAGLRASGVRQGDRVILLVPASPGYFATVCGAMLLGALPCTIPGPTRLGNADDALQQVVPIYEKLDPATVIMPVDMRRLTESHLDIDPARVFTADELLDQAPISPSSLPVLSGNHPLHVQMTSGSTSRPKAVVVSHNNVISNIRGMAEAIDLSPQTESGLTWLPFSHDFGFLQLLMAIYYQGSLVIMPTLSFLRDPLSWVRTISMYRTTHSAAPTFAYAMCVRKFDKAKLEGVDLSSWRRALVGADHISPKVLSDFANLFQPYGFAEQSLCPGYGMAETVLATTVHVEAGGRAHGSSDVVNCDYVDPELLSQDGVAVRTSPVGTSAEPAIQVVGVGRAIRGLEVEIHDADDRSLPDRAAGEICVRGTSLMQGYFRDPELTEEAIREGWYHTGDRGYLDTGELYVLGRIKETVIVRGRNFEAHDIESVIEGHQGVRPESVVAFGVYNPERGTDDVIAVIETKAAGDEQVMLKQQIQESLLLRFGFLARELLLVGHGTIPRTASYKKQRLLARSDYLKGRFTLHSQTS
jgi:acyl-CoA synthetase (AMP-forming)/AMP-acid ligase II